MKLSNVKIGFFFPYFVLVTDPEGYHFYFFAHPYKTYTMWPWQVCQKRERQRRDNFKIDPNNYIKSIPLPDGWFAYQTATGKVIYYNVVSKKSQWSPPPNSGYSKKNLLTGDAASVAAFAVVSNDYFPCPQRLRIRHSTCHTNQKRHRPSADFFCYNRNSEEETIVIF